MCASVNGQTSVKPTPDLRPAEERRRPPDRGIILLQAKDRIGPKIWALYGKVDKPTILKDDLYLDNSLNDFYRDANGYAFLLLPYFTEDDPNRFEAADAAYRRAAALGITEKPEVFFTCVYQFQLPDYRCVAIHKDKAEDILEEEKCLTLMAFEKARLSPQLEDALFLVESSRKIKPVDIISKGEASPNLTFALNMLAIHHHYDSEGLQAAWDNS